MFDAEQTAFLETGCGLILGTAGPDGQPHAGRGWGLTVLAVPSRVRLLLDAADSTTAEQAAGGGSIAITASSVLTLRSLQVKGTALSVDEATADDVERAARYCDDLFSDVTSTDGIPRELIERITPAGYLACTVHVEQAFDQTPGPGAGARLDSAPS